MGLCLSQHHFKIVIDFLQPHSLIVIDADDAKHHFSTARMVNLAKVLAQVEELVPDDEFGSCLLVVFVYFLHHRHIVPHIIIFFEQVLQSRVVAQLYDATVPLDVELHQ